jgi:hypothetical protein
MEHFLWPTIKKVCFPLEKQPDQTVPLKTSTPGTLGIIPFGNSERSEFIQAVITYRALKLNFHILKMKCEIKSQTDLMMISSSTLQFSSQFSINVSLRSSQFDSNTTLIVRANTTLIYPEI